MSYPGMGTCSLTNFDASLDEEKSIELVEDRAFFSCALQRSMDDDDHFHRATDRDIQMLHTSANLRSNLSSEACKYRSAC